MIQIKIPGTPIGGEDARERYWVESIVGGTSLAEVLLTFTLESGRRVDLDNLVRPAVRGLQKAGFYSRGYSNLESVTAIKRFGGDVGLLIEAGRPEPPSVPIFGVNSLELPVGDRSQEWKRGWSLEVSEHWGQPPIDGPVWISVGIRSGRSLIELMKPIIDGLEAVLGRDPRGRLQFCPNDHLIEWLQFRRVQTGSAISMELGVKNTETSHPAEIDLCS